MATKNFKNVSSSDVGLNTKKISEMQETLNDYINVVVKKIKIGASSKNIQLALKGTNSEVEVKKYIQEIDKACEEFVNSLKKYSSKLAEMAEVYKNKDSFYGIKRNSALASVGVSVGSKVISSNISEADVINSIDQTFINNREVTNSFNQELYNRVNEEIINLVNDKGN